VSRLTVRGVLLLVAAGCLTILTAMVLLLPAQESGRVLARVGSHGIHLFDVPALMIWGMGVTACAVAWRVPDAPG